MSGQTFVPQCLCLDIETAADDQYKLHKLAAWRPDTNASIDLKGAKLTSVAQHLDAVTDGAAFVVGHNILRHDLPVLEKLYPRAL